ncbi:sugar-specific transcriptional regulator TrmB/DNA-binding CsgD family transcriptional regulator [Kibdelosporangium banguiense]|uniref:Sugar-specific transcriptional regulator TrmB/DNA-binding CsgD family transcriptional regulator n=1 Tax=Kibdelosporangium banguiense TaxID=1365924 RepID=A0ABS4TX62_9PSEU|nr:winged helix-turn-helix transcriptional regulator [Kibdelosporangium banguiense]MBP2328982.1 sugar-specific transcriptional regulator TrmB/DNA-binding CsgD family transcriptional regulator [Kibdelosporangium banguiense]
MLEAVGLSPVDSRLYETVIRHPRCSTAELSEHCGLAARQVARRLTRLAAQGVITRIAGRPARYLAVAPDIAINGLVVQREQSLNATRAVVGELTMLYRASTRSASPSDVLEVVTGQDAVADQVEVLHRGARTEIRVFDKPPYARNPDEHRESGRQAYRPGMRYRIVYDRAALSWPDRLAEEILPEHHRPSVQARVRPALPFKLFLADRHQAVIPINTAPTAVDAAYVIHPSILLDSLAALFDAEWDRATPVGTPAEHSAECDLDESARRLLTLLAAGFTDEHVARSLGCSLRTAQRRVAELMRRLSATTRFQAALRARDRGLL